MITVYVKTLERACTECNDDVKVFWDCIDEYLVFLKNECLINGFTLEVDRQDLKNSSYSVDCENERDEMNEHNYMMFDCPDFWEWYNLQREVN